MSVAQAIFTVGLGNLIVLVPMLLNAHAGTRYGVPFPGRKLPREQWTRTRASLGPPGRIFDWRAVFHRDAPRVLDLGCGNGRFLIASAIARPDHDHLGIELVPQAVKFGSLRAGQRGLTNCKFAWGDATEFLLERCEEGTGCGALALLPQPCQAQRRAEFERFGLLLSRNRHRLAKTPLGFCVRSEAGGVWLCAA